VSFWDGHRWTPIAGSGPAAPRHPQPALVAWLATLVMVIGLAAIIIPTVGSQAATGRLGIDPGAARPGQRIDVRGSGLPPKSPVVLVWDGDSILRDVRTDRDGRIATRISVPSGAAVGPHQLAVRQPSAPDLLATAAVAVIAAAPAAVPSPVPTPVATPQPTPNPTPRPTPVPTPTARPATPAPTPAPATPPPATPLPATPAPAPARQADAALDVPAEFPSIQAAINAAQAGQTVRVAPGTYAEALTSVRPGVTVHGYGAVLRGTGVGRPSTAGGTYLLIHIKHANVTFAGFELVNAGRGARIEAAAGSRLIDLRIHDIGRTGIEISHGAVGAVVQGNRISRTGLANEGNAEAIYVGTARSASSWVGPDLTRDGVISGNALGPSIAEGIDIKDDVSGFLVVGNHVTGATEVDSGAINIRGHHNRLEGNVATGNAGSGFRFGGTAAAPAVSNMLVGNASTNNGGYGFKFIDGPQTGSGNTGAGNAKGFVTFGGASFPF
jgi:hypothetical protein